eukprot:s1281_g2.t1
MKYLAGDALAAAIIGKGGSTIAEIRTSCNAKLGLTDKGEIFPGTECRVLTVQANSEADLNQVSAQVIEKLVELVKSVGASEACGNDGELKLRALVPRGAVGSIIGKGGGVIKELRESTGAKISIGEPVGAGQNAEQIISISGSAEALRTVLAEVNRQIQLLANEPWFSTWSSSSSTMKALSNGMALTNPLLGGQTSGITTMMQVAQGMPNYVMEDSRGFALSCVVPNRLVGYPSVDQDLPLQPINQLELPILCKSNTAFFVIFAMELKPVLVKKDTPRKDRPRKVTLEESEVVVITDQQHEKLPKESYPKELRGSEHHKDRSRSSGSSGCLLPGKLQLEKQQPRSNSPDQKTLQDQIEQLETGWAKCVSDFRAQAEEVLMQHLDSLEEIQQAHEFEVANLMAENFLLREKLSLKTSEQVQGVMFQNMIPEPKKKATRGAGNRNAFQDVFVGCEAFDGRSGEDDDDASSKQTGPPPPSQLPPPSGHAPPGKQIGRKGKNQPGGTWQAFMAWVPTGASMQNPEPWKPLPQHEINAQGNLALFICHYREKEKGKRQVMKRKEPSDALAVLPGVPSDERHHKGDDDDSDSDSGRSLAGEEQFELLELWSASKKQAKKMKRGTLFLEYLGAGHKKSFRSILLSMIIATIPIISLFSYLRFDPTGAETPEPRSQAETESSMPFREEEDDYEEPVPHGWILNPDSNTRIAWDLGSLIMVLYDMVMIPMQAYDMPENAFLDFMEWTTRLFWTFDPRVELELYWGDFDGSPSRQTWQNRGSGGDIFFSCITGVVMTDGSVEYNIRIILKRYAKTWLTMDLIIVLSDWSEVVFSSGGPEILGVGFSNIWIWVAMLSFARTTRIVRIVRLLRLVRMQEIMANVTERIQSETLGPLVQVCKVLIVLLTISHFTGCLWFAVGARNTSESTWVKVLGYETQGVDAQYLAALHWALSQCRGPEVCGMDEISPASALERLFAVAVGGLIFVVALVMVGVFTSGLTQQYIIGGSGARQLATLKRYLKQNNVSKATTTLGVCLEFVI